jgi:hypothetical protein
MDTTDIFIGAICAAVGAAALAIAASNWSPGFVFWIGRLTERRYGRSRARLVYAAAGAALVALGIAIMCGFELADYIDLGGFFR